MPIKLMSIDPEHTEISEMTEYEDSLFHLVQRLMISIRKIPNENKL